MRLRLRSSPMKESRSRLTLNGQERRCVPSRCRAHFSYQGSFGSKGPVAYETLLLDSMRGDATLFTRRDEVERNGELSRRSKRPGQKFQLRRFPNYTAGSEGPKAADDLIKETGREWTPITQ